MKICSFCVMDTTCDGIIFNENYRCNFCIEYEKKLKKNFNDKCKFKNFNELLDKIKKHKKKFNNKYDCIVGVSGGIDSSYTLLKVVESGLKPLAVHFDNGWNSELAQNNIENLIKGLNVDYYTHVVRWTEYRNLMQSFFDADVIDVELLTDNAISAVNFKIASKENIPFILAGTNYSTEGMSMPKNMNWFKYDKKNIVSIHKKFVNLEFHSYPLIGLIDFIYYFFFKKIRWINFLDFFDYNKQEAERVLSEKYGYRTYHNKHYESVFTRFYQGYILLEKFKIDKRILHYSTLIVNGQMTRTEALKKLSQPTYQSKEEFINDKNFFLKKMNWEEKDLDGYLKRKEIKHDYYPSNRNLFEFLIKIYKKITL